MRVEIECYLLLFYTVRFLADEGVQTCVQALQVINKLIGDLLFYH